MTSDQLKPDQQPSPADLWAKLMVAYAWDDDTEKHFWEFQRLVQHAMMQLGKLWFNTVSDIYRDNFEDAPGLMVQINYARYMLHLALDNLDEPWFYSRASKGDDWIYGPVTDEQP